MPSRAWRNWSLRTVTTTSTPHACSTSTSWTRPACVRPCGRHCGSSRRSACARCWRLSRCNRDWPNWSPGWNWPTRAAAGWMASGPRWMTMRRRSSHGPCRTAMAQRYLGGRECPAIFLRVDCKLRRTERRAMNDMHEDDPEGSTESRPPVGAELSQLMVHLLKGVLYRQDDERLWVSLLSLQARVREQAAVLLLDLVLDEAEGYAFL